MTVVIIGSLDVRPVANLAAALRRRGFTVLALESMRRVALVMLTERVVALVVYQALAPADWEAGRMHLSQICPTTRVLVIASGDRRTPEQLARDSVKHVEP